MPEDNSKFKKHRIGIEPSIPLLKEAIEKSKNGTIFADIASLASEMKMSGGSKTNIYWGLKYVLFYQGIFVEGTEETKNGKMLVMRNRLESDVLPTSLENNETYKGKPGEDAREILERLSIERTRKDEDKDIGIRPKYFSDFIGQADIINLLRTYTEASKMRGEQLDHVLLSGPKGLGKTTLADIVANEKNATIYKISGPGLKLFDLFQILLYLKEGDILFIDEIHRMKKDVEEFLYSAMEDFTVYNLLWRQEKAKRERELKSEMCQTEYGEYQDNREECGYENEFRRSKFNASDEVGNDVGIEEFKRLNKFTLIGATTRVGLLSSPFSSRFDIKFRLELYNINDLSNIIKRTAGLLDIDIYEERARNKIARCSRGTPRTANGLVKRIRDFSTVRLQRITDIKISFQDVEFALKNMGIDNLGLEKMDRRILEIIGNDHNGGPVGGNNIAKSLGEDLRTLEEYYEPYLIALGLIRREGNGRVTTEKAHAMTQYNLKPSKTIDVKGSNNRNDDNEDNIIIPKDVPYKMR